MSLFNLQREHYTVQTSDYDESIIINTNQNCLVPKYEIVFNSHLGSKSLISSSLPTPKAPWKHHTVISKNIPCTIGDILEYDPNAVSEEVEEI